MNQDKNSSSGRGRYIAIAVLLVFLFICAGPLSWWFGRQSLAKRKVLARRAEITAQGLPIDDLSMEQYRSQSMSHEKSKVWMELLKELDSKEFGESCREIPIVGVPEEEIAFVPGEPYPYDEEVGQFLIRWDRLLTQLHEVTEGGEPIWTEIEFKSFSTLLNYVQATRTAARLLALEYEHAVRRHDHARAFRCIRALLGTARSLEKEPLIVSQMVRVAVNAIALQRIKQSVELDLLTESQLVSLLEELKSCADFTFAYRQGMIGERAMAQPVFEDPAGILGDESMSAVGSRVAPRWIDAMEHLDWMEQALEIETQDLNEFLNQVGRLEEEFSELGNNQGILGKIDTALTQMTIPALSAYGTSLVANAMRVRLAKVGLAIRIYEKRRGSLPKELQAAIGSASGLALGSTEPVGTKPWGYRLEKDTALLWGFELVTSNKREVPAEPPTADDLDVQVAIEPNDWLWKIESKTE